MCFSNKFLLLELRSGKIPNNKDSSCYRGIFNIIYRVSLVIALEVPITLKRSSGIDQSVQLLYVLFQKEVLF